jgi:hypothetical protein
MQINSEFSFNYLNKEKAFCLGVIFGDGHVDNYKIVIYSSNKDEVLNNINNSLFYNKLKIFNDKRNNGTYINLYKKTLCDELRNIYKLNSNKSKTLIFPTNIDDRFMPFFISGYLAADGSISCFDCSKYNKGLHLRVCFTSCSNNFLIGLRDFINKKTKIYSKIYKQNRNKNYIYNLSYNYGKALIVCNYIFKNTNKYLRCKRKYDNYKIFVKNINNSKRKILKLHNDGFSIIEIKKQVHKHESFIRNIIKGINIVDAYKRNLVDI